MSMEMGRKLRVGVIFGGRAGECEISLMSARSVLSLLDPHRYDVTQIGITHEGAWLTGNNVLEAMEKGQLEQLQVATLLPDPAWAGIHIVRKSEHGNMLELLVNLDVIFPVLHGPYGEDGTVQGLLEMADMAYVGAGVVGSAVGMDKGIFKDVMRAHDIPVVDWMIVSRLEIEHNVGVVVEQALKLA